jgi:hypothetical protein
MKITGVRTKTVAPKGASEIATAGFSHDSLAEVRVSRTHRRLLRATAGFEDREDHRSLGTSISAITCIGVASLPSRYDLI